MSAITSLFVPGGSNLPVRPRFNIQTPKEFMARVSSEWLVKGVLPSSGVASIFGPSKAGKSFLTVDLIASLASGENWHGYATKPSRVLCMVLEGQEGFSRRLWAWAHHRGRDFPENVGFVSDEFDMTDPSQQDTLLHFVKKAGGFNVIVIDTLNRAAPEGDENASGYMNKVIRGASRLQAGTNGLVILVHHTGKDASRGPRGHSSFYNALDVAIEVSSLKGERVWKLSKAKDSKDGAVHAFTLAEVHFDDARGEARTSCVAEPCGVSNVTKDIGSIQAMTANQAIAWKVAQEMIQTSMDVGGTDMPANSSWVSLDDLMQQVMSAIPVESKRKKERAHAALSWLVTNKFLDTTRGQVFLYGAD